MEWFASQGALISLPVGHSPDYDLIAEMDGRLLRVEVKTSRCRTGNGWAVALRTSGGNQSWSGVVKLWATDRCDLLFVTVGDGRRWCMPSSVLGDRGTIKVGGSKWDEFEVSRGRPLEEVREPFAVLDGVEGGRPC